MKRQTPGPYNDRNLEENIMNDKLNAQTPSTGPETDRKSTPLDPDCCTVPPGNGDPGPGNGTPHA
jgi:hypothetical protein